MAVKLLLLVAAAGLVSCTAFLVLSMLSAMRFRRRSRRGRLVNSSTLPRVSLLKPLCGLEPQLEDNLESFFQQDYPEFEIIFGTRHAHDPALALVREIQRRYTNVRTKIVVSGEPDRPNAKVCSLEKMYAAAANNYLVISDSDVRVAPNYVGEIVAPLLDRTVGLVNCLYRGVPTGGIWSRLEALGMSVEMSSGVIIANMLEGMKFALGPTMAIRREVLDAIGGFGVLADYCADDYVLGHAVHDSGHRVLLSHHVIDHLANHRSFKGSVLHQVRWMKSTRFSRPKGHLGTGLTFAMPFGILGLAAGIAGGHSLLGPALFGWALLHAAAMSVIVGWGVVRDPRSLRYCWLYPVREFMGFCFWCTSFAGRNIVWRGVRYRLELGGKMERVGVSVTKQRDSAAVAVDNLA
jgi:ceramide glucosyltransferase